MNRIDIAELRVHVGSPAVTIIAPYEKSSLEARTFNLISKLNLESFEIDALKKQVTVLLKHVTFPEQITKVGFFINKHIVRLYPLSSDVELCETLDTYFHLDDIVKSLNRKERYFILACDPWGLIFYEGCEDVLIEVIHTKTGLSWKYGQPIGSLQGTLCSTKAPTQCMYTNAKDFYRELDAHLNHYIEQDPAPLLIYGSQEHNDMFKMHSQYAHVVCAYIQDITLAKELAQECYHTLYTETLARIKPEDPLVLIDQSANYQQVATAAIEGSVEMLLVAKDFHKAGCEDKITGNFSVGIACSQNVNTIDIIDALIETVKSKRGNVLFVPTNFMERYNNVVAFMRF